MLKDLEKFVKQGLIDDVQVMPDPTVVAVYVRQKFRDLPLDAGAAVANELCTEISQRSQADGSSPENAVGKCELLMSASHTEIGEVTFGEDGKAVTTWRPWWVQAKSRR